MYMIDHLLNAGKGPPVRSIIVLIGFSLSLPIHDASRSFVGEEHARMSFSKITNNEE
jgi:hypothetical protein